MICNETPIGCKRLKRSGRKQRFSGKTSLVPVSHHRQPGKPSGKTGTGLPGRHGIEPSFAGIPLPPLCGASSVDDFYMGCPDCRKDGHAASVAATYTPAGDRYQALPFSGLDSNTPGNTPLHHLEKLASKMGLADLWLKEEGANPTGSHKDRLSPLVTARAKGLKKRSVIVASSERRTFTGSFRR